MTFSKPLPHFSISSTFSAVRCKEGLIWLKTTENHHFGQSTNYTHCKHVAKSIEFLRMIHCNLLLNYKGINILKDKSHYKLNWRSRNWKSSDTYTFSAFLIADTASETSHIIWLPNWMKASQSGAGSSWATWN